MNTNSIIYSGTPQQRVKREITTVTRTFDENENLVEERTETETEYEYVSQHGYTYNPGYNYPFITSGSTWEQFYGKQGAAPA